MRCSGAHARGVALPSSAGSAIVDPADFRLAFAAVGAHECAIDGSAPIRLEPRHTLVVARNGEAPDGPLVIRPLDAAAVALAVRIECR